MKKKGGKEINVGKRIKGIKRIDKIYLIFLRYIILLGLVFTLPLIYKIFTPLTLWPVAGLLGLVYEKVVINQIIISINNTILFPITL